MQRSWIYDVWRSRPFWLENSAFPHQISTCLLAENIAHSTTCLALHQRCSSPWGAHFESRADSRRKRFSSLFPAEFRRPTHSIGRERLAAAQAPRAAWPGAHRRGSLYPSRPGSAKKTHTFPRLHPWRHRARENWRSRAGGRRVQGLPGKGYLH